MVKNTYNWLFLFFIWLFPLTIKSQEVLTDSIPEEQKNYTKALKLIDSTKYKDAISLLKDALDMKEDYWQAYNKLAFCKIKLKDYKGAERDLENSDLIYPVNFETYKLSGINYYLNNKFNESKAALDTASKIAKDEKIYDWELCYYRALLMFKGKSYKTALEALGCVTELNPNFIEAVVLKGEINFILKEYNYSIKDLNEAIQKMNADDINYRAYKFRAKDKFEIKDFKGAVADWNVYIDGIPKEEEALISRASAKIECRDNTGAITDLNEAIKINSKNPVSYCKRAIAKSENKEFQEALKDYAIALKLKFDYADAYYNRAATKMAIKDKYGACDDLNKADGLGSEYAGTMYDRYCK